MVPRISPTRFSSLATPRKDCPRWTSTTRRSLEGNGPARSGFLSAFFTLVGTHGAHVTFGLIWMAVVLLPFLLPTLLIRHRSRSGVSGGLSCCW